MRCLLSCFVVCCSVASAQTIPPIRLPHVPVIVEPDDAPPTPPAPSGGPSPVSTITPDVWYVIESDVPLICLHSPVGHIEIQEDEGPVRVRGRFADGNGKPNEVRTFSAKHLYFVAAVTPGKVELLLVPKGLSSETDVVRQTLTVMGLGPQPPPGPEPQPDPEPQPTADNLQIEVVEDVLNRTVDTAIVLNFLATWNELKDAGHDWRVYDKTTGEGRGKEAVTAAGTTELPALIVRDKESRKVIRVMPLPKDVDGFKRLLGELGAP